MADVQPWGLAPAHRLLTALRRLQAGWRTRWGLTGLLAALLLAPLAPAGAATYTNASTPFRWINPSGHTKVGYATTPYKFNGGSGTGCGTTPPRLDDTISDLIPIGFSFVFGTTTYTSLRVQTNGRLQFGNATCGYGTGSIGPPQTYPLGYPESTLNNTMRVFGADLDPTNLVDVPNYPSSSDKTPCTNISSCYVSVATVGTAPMRQFVVTWYNVPEWVAAGNTSGSFTVQVVLNEDGSFVYQYHTIVHGGTGTGQVGWQLDSSDYTVLSFGAASEPGNGTAIKFYVAAAILADYRFEEGAWAIGVAGQVRDSSGNGWHGTAMGSVSSSGSGYVCRGARIAANSEGGNVYGIDTGLPMDGSSTNLLGTGVVMMWVKLDDAWSGAGARNAQLMDASTVSGEWFQVTKRSDGTVRFTVTDSLGTVYNVTTSAFSYAAGTWQHVAVSWSFNGNPGTDQDYISIAINGGTPTVNTLTSDGTLATSLGNLFIGDNPLGVSASGHSVNSASGLIDAVKVLNYIPSDAQFLALKNATHACDTYTIDHLELRHGSWSGVGCSVDTLTVLACADTSFPCSNPYTKGLTASFTTSGGSVTWVPAADATVIIPWGGSSATKQLYVTPGTVTLGATASPSASAATRCNGAGSSCLWTSNTSGLLVNAPTVIGGQTAAVTVRAVSSVDATTCTSVANTSNSLRLWANGVSPSSFAGTSTSAGVTVGGPPKAGVSAGSVSLTLPQTQPGSSNLSGLSYDSTAQTSLYLLHMDTGSFTLSARMDTTTPVQTLTGSATVTVLPVGLAVVTPAAMAANASSQSACTSSGSACDTAAGASPKVAAAGDSFSMSVQAALWTGAGDPDYADNPVAPSFTATASLSPVLLAPQGGSTGSLAVTSVTLSGGSTGTLSQRWTQVGALRIDASATYLGNSLSGRSVVLGRVAPKYLRTTLTTAGCGSFTYSGQAMTSVAVAAMDGASTPAVTPNYRGDFARTVTLSDSSGAAGTMTANTLAASAFSSGTASLSPVFSFTSKTTAPASLSLRASDGETTSAGTSGAEASAALRSGRLRLSNAFGAASASLQVPLTAEYWGGNSWQVNSSDGCTSVPASAVVLSNPRSAQGNVSTATSSVSAVVLTAGNGRITLAKPSPSGSSLSLDLALNLGSTTTDQACTTSHPASTGAGLAWLRSANGSCASTADRDPGARASFGIYSPETRKTVHAREIY